MKAAYDCGVNFFDCAEVYAEGESEIVMGEAIKKYGWKRNDLVISTKVSWLPDLIEAEFPSCTALVVSFFRVTDNKYVALLGRRLW